MRAPESETPGLPDWDELGCDPEPFGVRFERLLDRPQYGARARSVGTPAVCPLNRRPCEGEICPFYRVPGIRHECAVEEWAPQARTRPALAHWFRTIRDRMTER